MTRHRTVERSDVIARTLPLLAAAAPYIGHVAIRTRGTVGGSLSHADPAAELPAVALALDATFTACTAKGEREIAARRLLRRLLHDHARARRGALEHPVPERAVRHRRLGAGDGQAPRRLRDGGGGGVGDDGR